MTSPLLLLLLGVSLSQAQVRVYNIEARNLRPDATSAADGFVKVSCGSVSMGQTTIKNNNANPWWSDEFTYSKAKQNDVLRLTVYDKDVTFDDLLGDCRHQIRVGTYSVSCSLSKGGTLYFKYTLN